MKYTNNYRLNKPEQTDYYNVDDFNTNADIVDEKIKEIDTQLSATTQYKFADSICNDPNYKPSYIGDVEPDNVESGVMPSSSWHSIIHLAHRYTDGHGSQIAVSVGKNPSMYLRGSQEEEWGRWNRIPTAEEIDRKLDKKISYTSYISKGANLDDYINEGLYCIGVEGHTILNTPVSTGAFSLFVEKTGAYGNGVKQTFTDSTYANTYIRTSSPLGSTGWTQWNRISTEAELTGHTGNSNNPHNVTAAQVGASNPNLLINGDFQIWQRGTVFVNSNWQYMADRWFINSHSPITRVEKWSNGIRITPNSTGHTAVFQRIEDEMWNKLAGKTITVSYSKDGQISSSTYTLQADASYGKAIGVYFENINTPFTINWIKAELGSYATQFVPRQYSEEMAMCQRYYRQLNGVYFLAFALGLGSSWAGAFQLDTEGMRVTPSVVFKMPSDSSDLCNVYSVSSAANYPAAKFTFREVSADGLYNFTTTVNENERNLAIRGGNGSYADAEIY